MKDFLFNENAVRSEKQIEFIYTDRAHQLSRMNIVDRLDKIECIGDDHIYRFHLEAQLKIKGEAYGFDTLIDICADNFDSAEQAAIDFFYASHLDAIFYYLDLIKQGADVKFICRNLYTAEEAVEANEKQIAEEEGFMNFLSVI